MIKSFDELLELARKKGPKVLSVAAAHDEEVLLAVKEAKLEKIIIPILVGDSEKINLISQEIDFDLTGVEIIDSKDDSESSLLATELVSSGKADLLMKGLVSTGTIMKAVLNKEVGLRGDGIISHVAVFQVPTYHKMFLLSDAAMNIKPSLEDKKKIMENSISLAHALHIDKPKVAILAAMESVSDKMEATLDAKAITDDFIASAREDAIVYGPLALDNAVSIESAKLKKIDSEVAGDADILLVPFIEAGNVLYKSLTFLGSAKSAGLIVGTKAPVVLTSRADDDLAKLNSIALGVLMASK